METSFAYKEAVAKGTFFQNTHKSWAGNDSKNYVTQIKHLVSKYNANSVLDYGCGKGFQYTNPIKDLKPFNERCGFESYYLYDPCVEQYKVPPSPNQKFDAIICLQVIKHIPNQDIPWLKQLFERTATKFVLIGDFDPAIKQKPSKITNTDAVNRNVEWYHTAFRDWNSPAKLHWCWRRPQTDIALQDNKNIRLP